MSLSGSICSTDSPVAWRQHTTPSCAADAPEPSPWEPSSPAGATSSTRQTRVMIVEDYRLLAECQRLVIDREPDFHVCAQTWTGPQAVIEVESCHADVILVGIDSDPVKGLALVKQLVQRWPAIPVVVVSSDHGKFYSLCASEIGARGYVSRPEPSEALLSALRLVTAGKTHFRSEWLGRNCGAPEGEELTGTHHHPEKLTRRESQVLRYLAEGRAVSEIAPRLSLSTGTVMSYCASVARKLDLESSHRLRNFAAPWAVVSGCF